MAGKAEFERYWYLNQYADGVWMQYRLPRFKKWQAHRNRLIRDGLLEEDAEYSLLRLTDKGRKVLEGGNE